MRDVDNGIFRSAFSARLGGKSRDKLPDLAALAFGAGHLLFVMCGNGKRKGEFLIASVTLIIIRRHKLLLSLDRRLKFTCS
jgi:hypothetical protein